jgi:hypothetical protein
LALDAEIQQLRDEFSSSVEEFSAGLLLSCSLTSFPGFTTSSDSEYEEPSVTPTIARAPSAYLATMKQEGSVPLARTSSSKRSTTSSTPAPPETVGTFFPFCTVCGLTFVKQESGTQNFKQFWHNQTRCKNFRSWQALPVILLGLLIYTGGM